MMNGIALRIMGAVPVGGRITTLKEHKASNNFGCMCMGVAGIQGNVMGNVDAADV